MELGNRSHKCDALLFFGFPLYMLSLFQFFRLPCTMTIGMGLIVLTEVAVWYAYPAENRPPFPLQNDWTVRADVVQRLASLLLLLGILFAAVLIFQEGYLLWLTFPWTPLLIVLPLAGIILPTPGQLREYLSGGLYALVMTAMIYGIGQLFTESTLRADWGIIIAYIFLELLTARMINPILPKIRNSSLIILGFSALVTVWIMPPICNPWIVTLSMYVLYLLIDNRRAIRKKIFSRAHFHRSDVHLLSWEEYAAQAWGFGALLAGWLAGPQLLKQILIGLGAVLAAGLIRLRLLHDSRSEHLILRNFPYILEFWALVLSAMFFSKFTSGSSRDTVMILLSIYAASSCIMQMIWDIGGLIGRYADERPSMLFFHVFCRFGIGFLLVLLFFIQAPASILLGFFCCLNGIVKIADDSFRKTSKNLSLTAGWVLIVIGQFVFVSSAETILPEPKWSAGSPVCALIACAALYICRLFDFRNRRIHGS